MAAKRSIILIYAMIAFAITFTSLTSLRFPGVPVGVSEIMLLTCMVLHLPFSFGVHTNNSPRYFVVVVFILFFATIPGFFITLIQDGTVDFALYNLFALAYIALLMTYLHYGFNYQAAKFDNLIVFFITFSVLYFVLLLALLYFDPNLVYFQDDIESIESIGSDGAAGINVTKIEGPAYRLVGFSENPNQLALHALILAFFCVSQWRRLGTILGTLCLTVSLAVGLLTQSDAFLISAMALIFVSVVMGIVYGQSVILGLTVLVPSIVGLVLIYRPALTLFREIAQHGEQDETRYNLWVNGIEAGLTRPLTGMGPGIWSGEEAPFEQIEAHNTAIDYFSMSGVPGTMVLVVAGVYMIFYCVRSGRSSLLAGFIAIALYSAFHNILRHPMVWLAIYAIAHGVWVQSGNVLVGSSKSKRRRKRKHRFKGLEV